MKTKVLSLTLVSICSLLLVSCSKNGTTSIENSITDTTTESVQLTDEQVAFTSTTLTGIRSSEPVCFMPAASATTVYSNSLAAIDASNTAEGYVMVDYKGTNGKVKLQITGPNNVTYTYNLYSYTGYEAFPLSAGSGKYKVAVYENISGNQYSTALSENINVTITNVFGPNLYSNQYVNFTPDCKTVAQGQVLATNCDTDLDVVSKIYNYVSTNITYDHTKAATVQSGYTSDVDVILESGTGICLDYAAVMTSMLRSQCIPTRLEVGYAGTAYHAWISCYITDIGWVNGIIEFDGTSWSLMDPTFAANSSETALKNFIGDGSNYKTKYIY